MSRENKRRKYAHQKRESNKSHSKQTVSRVLILVLIGSVLICSGIAVYYKLPQTNEVQRIDQKEGQVPADLVCMVFDSYKGVKQIPVDVGGVIYYGCCEGCVQKIKYNLNNVRYATDPMSKKQVDKGKAFIALNPKGKGSVLYFESEENYKNYIKNR